MPLPLSVTFLNPTAVVPTAVMTTTTGTVLAAISAAFVTTAAAIITSAVTVVCWMLASSTPLPLSLLPDCHHCKCFGHCSHHHCCFSCHYHHCCHFFLPHHYCCHCLLLPSLPPLLLQSIAMDNPAHAHSSAIFVATNATSANLVATPSTPLPYFCHCHHCCFGCIAAAVHVCCLSCHHCHCHHCFCLALTTTITHTPGASTAIENLNLHCHHFLHIHKNVEKNLLICVQITYLFVVGIHVQNRNGLYVGRLK